MQEAVALLGNGVLSSCMEAVLSSRKYLFPLMTKLDQSDEYLTPWLPELWHWSSSSECRYRIFFVVGFFVLVFVLVFTSIPTQLSVACGFLSRSLPEQVFWNKDGTLLENNLLKEVPLVWDGISVKEEVEINSLADEVLDYCWWHDTWSHSSEVWREPKVLTYFGLSWLFFVHACEKILVLCCKVKSIFILKGVSFQDESIPFFCVFSSYVSGKFLDSCAWTAMDECFVSPLAKRCCF